MGEQYTISLRWTLTEACRARVLLDCWYLLPELQPRVFRFILWNSPSKLEMIEKKKPQNANGVYSENIKRNIYSLLR